MSARFQETVRQLMRDLDAGDVAKTAASVGRVLGVSVERVIEAAGVKLPRTKCRQGHALVQGERCRECHRAQVRRHDAKRAARAPIERTDSTPGPEPRTECLRGHDLRREGATILRANGSRRCRECHREDVRAYDKRRPKRDRAAEAARRSARVLVA